MSSTLIILSITKLSSDKNDAIKRNAKGKDDEEVSSLPVISNVDNLLVVCTLLLQLISLIATNPHQSDPYIASSYTYCFHADSIAKTSNPPSFFIFIEILSAADGSMAIEDASSTINPAMANDLPVILLLTFITPLYSPTTLFSTHETFKVPMSEKTLVLQSKHCCSLQYIYFFS